MHVEDFECINVHWQNRLLITFIVTDLWRKKSIFSTTHKARIA